jgi:CubicO group peptidase (beta-lactamase class C family)
MVGLLRDGAFQHCKAYGLANVEWENPITPDTVFAIASLTKQFTAVAIMMLKERGLVSLDSPLQTWLPDFPTDGRRVTLRHLLNHTSGLTSYERFPNYREISRLHLSLADVLERMKGHPFEFEPGERYLYNNSGYVLLGAIIERASGLKYRDFLAREIFDPLGMSRTLYLFDETVVPCRAAGYQNSPDGIRNGFYVSPTHYHAAGGLGSTVRDLARWDRAVRGNMLISAESFAEMLRPTVLTDGSEYPYGYGWGTATYLGRRIYHHTGGRSGFAAHMLHLRDEDLTLILLSNLYLFPIDRVTRALLRCALNANSPIQHHRDGDAVPLAACTGRFRMERGVVRTLAIRGEKLAFDEPDGPTLIPVGDGRYAEEKDPEVEYRFGDFHEGRYGSFCFSTPLFPATAYTRVA